MEDTNTSDSNESAVQDSVIEPTSGSTQPTRPRPRQFKKVEVVIPRRTASATDPSVPTRSHTSAKKERTKRPTTVRMHTDRFGPLNYEQRQWLRTEHLDGYIQVRKDPIALDAFRSVVWDNFIVLWPEYNNPPFPEELDMTARFQASKARSVLLPTSGVSDMSTGIALNQASSVKDVSDVTTTSDLSDENNVLDETKDTAEGVDHDELLDLCDEQEVAAALIKNHPLPQQSWISQAYEGQCTSPLSGSFRNSYRNVDGEVESFWSNAVRPERLAINSLVDLLQVPPSFDRMIARTALPLYKVRDYFLLLPMSSSRERNPSPQPERFYRWHSPYDLEQLRLFYLQARNTNQGTFATNVHRNPGGRPSGAATAQWDDDTGPVTRALRANPTALGDSQARDVVITVSQDHRREFVKRLPEPAGKKKKKRRRMATNIRSDDADWNPSPDDVTAAPEDDDEEGAFSVLMEAGGLGDGEEDLFAGPGKRKRYASSDNPMSKFLPGSQSMLLETLRREGLHGMLGDSEPCCVTCGMSVGAALEDGGVIDTLFRCDTCGEFVECKGCCLARHQRTPLHNIKSWSGDFWERTSLSQLGAVFQLGHHGGVCIKPERTRPLTVIHVNGVHTLNVAFCGCRVSEDLSSVEVLLRNGWYPATTIDPASCATYEVLDKFRLLSVVAQVNVRDFVTVLEQITAPHRTEKVPDRYKAFGRMSRQWAYLMRLRRAGVGHIVGGVTNATPGSVAVCCWACPREGINIPPDWRENSKNRFLYRLILCMDANFRLKSRLRRNSKGDAPLYMGLGYQVHLDDYFAHLRTYVQEKDISSCVAFAAMMQKESRLTAGLRVSGVGGCFCSRHECVRPQGFGDLQKGERWSNMDYIYCSASSDIGGLDVLLSYDIACQYGIHIDERRTKLPEHLRAKPDDGTRTYALPVWHGDVHAPHCKTCWSLQYQLGAAKTDGEAPERVWSVMNGMASDTKEMDTGNRHDRIEDRCDKHNFTKNIGLGKLLGRRLVIARAEKLIQNQGYQEIHATLRSSLASDWMQMVSDWEADHSKPCPYIVSAGVDGGVTEQTIRADLRTEELVAAAENRANTKDCSPLSIVLQGLHLEQMQRSIRQEAASTVLVALGRIDRIQEKRVAFLRQLKIFRRHQRTIMPGAIALWEAEEDRIRNAHVVVLAEDIKLWLPSSIPVLTRSQCDGEIFSIETKLRFGQCSDALAAIRLKLTAKRHLIKFRNKNVTGQSATTRAKGLIDSVSEKIDAHTLKYRAARLALTGLVTPEELLHLKELHKEDLDIAEEAEADVAAARRLGRVGGREARTTAEALRRQTKNKMSWIWTAMGGPNADDPNAMHESVRVEYCKALARSTRWDEEVALLSEEMRRTLQSLKNEAAQWRERAMLEDPTVWEEFNQGRKAYALKQASHRESMHDTFMQLWSGTRDATGRGDGSENVDDTRASRGSITIPIGGATVLTERQHVAQVGVDGRSDPGGK